MGTVPSARIPANKVEARLEKVAFQSAQWLSGTTARVVFVNSSIMKRNLFCSPLAVIPMAISLSLPVLAQNQLKETVVTATRTQSKADALISDVTVITREDIERGIGRTLPEVLARVSGLQMSANGGLGKNSSVFIRGTESRHVLLLVDGVRYGSATTGQANFDTIALETIERIEVLKGPASALYGSDAVGGVVQIFLRKGTAGLQPYASVTVGSEERQEISAGLRGGSADVRYALGVQTLREKGFSATNPKVAFAGFNADADGFNQSSVNASVDWKFTPGWKLDAKVMSVEAVNQYDSGAGAFDTRSNLGTQLIGLGLEGQLLSQVKTRLAFARSGDRNTDIAAAATTRFNTTQDQTSWLNEIATPVGTVTIGFERLAQGVDSTTAYTTTSRTTDSWLAGLAGSSDAHSWQFNLRRDQDSQFGEATTGLAGYGYRFTPAWRVHGSYGTSFKAPSFNTLYFPAFGNATTQPEYGTNIELGVAYAQGDQELTLTRFQNRIKGFITTLPVVANIPYARIEGWTLAYNRQSGALNYRAALDLLDARNEATNLKLIRRADQQLTAGLDYTTGAWKLGTSLLVASERFDNAANTLRLDGYTTLDLSADYAVAKNWTLQARLNNVTDAVYQTANGYNQAGRAAYFTLRYQPQ